MRKQRHFHGKKIRKDWRDKIQVGDVLEAPSGDLRVVREVKMRGGCGLVGWVTFAIRNCSWTNRCYTILSRTDLRIRGFRPTRQRAALRGKVDKLIKHDIEHHYPEDQILTCCDVKAVP